MIWLGNFWYFGKLVAEERWSLTRGGRNRRYVGRHWLPTALNTTVSITFSFSEKFWTRIIWNRRKRQLGNVLVNSIRSFILLTFWSVKQRQCSTSNMSNHRVSILILKVTALFLFTCESLALTFYSEHVETKETTKANKHTFRNSTLTLIKSRILISLDRATSMIAMASKMTEAN